MYHILLINAALYTENWACYLKKCIILLINAALYIKIWARCRKFKIVKQSLISSEKYTNRYVENFWKCSLAFEVFNLFIANEILSFRV